MKKIIMIGIAILLSCCGEPTDPSRECFADHDCESREICIDGICVFEPECTIDEDCHVENEICNEEYQCVDFWNDSECLGELCYGKCETCDQYTACDKGVCINACDVFNITIRNYLINICKDTLTCLYCICTIQGLETMENMCGSSIERECTHINSVLLAKQSLNNITNITNDYYNIVKEQCK